MGQDEDYYSHYTTPIQFGVLNHHYGLINTLIFQCVSGRLQIHTYKHH